LVPYDEEKVTNFEVGLKSEYLDNRLRFNASLYYYDWDDLQVQIARDGALFTINAGKAVGQGLDLELTYLLGEGLTLTAAYGYLDAEYDEDVPGSSINKGDILLYAPEHSANLGIDYFTSVSDALNLRASLSYNYVGAQYLSPGIEDDSYGLLNGRLALLAASDKWEVSLWGRNLTDESYLESVTDFFDDFGYISSRRNEPRTYGAELTYRFR